MGSRSFLAVDTEIFRDGQLASATLMELEQELYPPIPDQEAEIELEPELEPEPEPELEPEPEPEETLPPGWHRTVSSTGRAVYVNHDMRLAQYDPPE